MIGIDNLINPLQELIQQQFSMRIAILCLLLALALADDITIKWTCGACSKPQLGKNCWTFDGNPFNHYQTSIDSDFNSCDATQVGYPRNVGFFCRKDNCEEDCKIYTSKGGSQQATCPVRDTNNMVILLNQVYKEYTGSKSYDWCKNAGCANSKVSLNMIVGLSVGGGVLIIAIAIGICCWRKRKAKKGLLIEERD